MIRDHKEFPKPNHTHGLLYFHRTLDIRNDTSYQTSAYFTKIRPAPVLSLVLLLFSAQVEEFGRNCGVAPGDVIFVREGEYR
jgi:hypothetical protein